MNAQAKVSAVTPLSHKFAQDDRDFAQWCRDMAKANPKGAAFYLGMAFDADKRVKAYEKALS